MLLIFIQLAMAGPDKTEIDFEEVEIEGQIKKPKSALIQENKRAIFNPLINIRMDWSMEMQKSVKDIQ